MFKCFWYVALKHSRVQEYKNLLDNYIDASASVLFGLETTTTSHHVTQGEHIHCAADISPHQFKLFTDTVHRKHLKLNGRAKDGQARQYGSVKNIRDQSKLLSYTVKDNNVLTWNVSEEDLQDWKEHSYPKQDVVSRFKLIQDHLEKFEETMVWQQLCYGPKQFEEQVILYHMLNPNGKALTGAQVKQAVIHYLQHSSFDTSSIHNQVDKVWNYLFRR